MTDSICTVILLYMFPEFISLTLDGWTVGYNGLARKGEDPYRKLAGQGHQEGGGGGRGRGRAGQLVGGGGGRGGPHWGCGVPASRLVRTGHRRGMVRGGRVEWGKAPTLKFNATYLVDYHSVGLLWPKLGVFTSIT